MAPTSMNTYDVVVIGAGHNGLTTAAMLAADKKKVLVLERRDVIGGLAAYEDFHEGFHSPGVLQESLLDEKIILFLLNEGPDEFQRPQGSPIFLPQRDGPGLLLSHDANQAKSEIEKHSSADAKRYVEYRAFLERIYPFFNRLLNQMPPNINDGGLSNMLSMAKTGLKLRRLGRQDMMEILRIGPMCVADWLNEWFETEALKCLLAMPSITCSSTGPWSPATNAMLLRHEFLKMNGHDDSLPSDVVSRIAKTARSLGVEIRTNSGVSDIRISNGVIQGVTLEDGESFDVPIVAASCDPKTLFDKLIHTSHLPVRLEDRIAHYRCTGTTLKVNLALDGPLRFACRPELEVERAVIAESLDVMEQAFDPIKYNRLPEKPILDIRVPTVSNPDLAPKGKHVVSILAHFVPYDLEGGWTDEARETIGDTVVERLAQYVPAVKGNIIAREVLTPVDIETRYGVTGGHLHHGEHGLDQMITRPIPECARYATPIKGLYLCGSGSHPGGGITGLPGSLAAQAILSAKK
ncbi:MAG: NAD(P)/FAD-dependent oxidoreductase [Planctomycetota bacterium]|nr:NAD(P)/FAD-dependent oxidoreductase [Planctomycetota bacterium]